jgi:hypothetical protein
MVSAQGDDAEGSTVRSYTVQLADADMTRLEQAVIEKIERMEDDEEESFDPPEIYHHERLLETLRRAVLTAS